MSSSPALQRRVPGPGKPLRPRPRAQLVQRLEALPDPLGRHLDDARRGERGDKAALELGRDRIAARGGVEEGGEGEERIVLLGFGRGVRDDGGGLASELAGGFGHLSTVIARSRRRRGNPEMRQSSEGRSGLLRCARNDWRWKRREISR
jgi:hypothetical protein